MKLNIKLKNNVEFNIDFDIIEKNNFICRKFYPPRQSRFYHIGHKGVDYRW